MRVINRVSFIHPIPIGGDLHSIEAYDRSKHHNLIDVVERNGFLVLLCKSGGQRRIPWTNIAFVHETDDGKDEPAPSKAAK